ncbi:MAG: PadR family transcriptional regulator [Pyrinomonadaceae bacterium]
MYTRHKNARGAGHPRGRGPGFGHREFGHGGFRGDPMRMRKGKIKFILLGVLKDGPRHGYDIIKQLEADGGYKPSPGSVYPTLQMLEEGDFVSSEEIEGKKVYSITDDGLELLKTKGEAEMRIPQKMKDAFEVRNSMHKLGVAARNAVREGDQETTKKIGEILDKARKEIYSILAED